MKLQTQIPFKKQANNCIDYNSKLLLLGSCFVENIGRKLSYFKFQNTINPFGILFHPVAIENVINNSVEKKEFSEKDIFFHNEQWHCFDAHSSLSHSNKDDVLKWLNKNVELTHHQIVNASHVVVTLGTAWVYRYVIDDKVVANCHKIPQNQFKKVLLSVEEITTSLHRIYEKIRLVNSKSTIIFTVSPVRHIKDGFVENMRSKSHLITAIHQIVKETNSSFYFPSYEVMMDELRDYRFYEEDMIHPNLTAINYIWEKFTEVWLDISTKEIMSKVDVIQKGLLHKPFNSNAKAHQQFLNQLKENQKVLRIKFPHMVF